MERAVRIPDGLPWFSARFRDRFYRAELPTEDDVRAIEITYNLAFALAGPEHLLSELLTQYLPRAAQKFGPGLDWNRLIGDAEWGAFPREALLDLLLADIGDTPAGRELQAAVEDAVARRELVADSRLAGWWAPGEPRKLRRLLALLAHDPPLVSAFAAAKLTSRLPLLQIAAEGPVHGALAAEARAGMLVQRTGEGAELAELARDRQSFEVLSRAVSEGGLDPGWARAYVRAAQEDELFEAARHWLKEPRFWTAWGNVPRLLLDRLRALTVPPADLAPLIVKAGLGLGPVADLEIYLSLADLLASIEQQAGQSRESPLMARLWQELPRLTEARNRDDLVGMALDRSWRCLQPRSLVVGGRSRLPWAKEIADRLVGEPEIAGALATSALLELSAGFHEESSHEILLEQLAERMRREPHPTTDVLIHSGWWYTWRSDPAQRSLPPEECQKIAFAWMTSDAWHEGHGIEATLEAWRQALKDLPQKISGLQMVELCGNGTGPERRWPWIPPFEQEQLAELSARAGDLGAVAELADALRSDRLVQALGGHSDRLVLDRLPLQGEAVR